MRLVRQRFQPQGAADATDSPNAEADGPMDESEPEVASGPISDEALEGMLEFLKGEHGLCLERGEYWDANEVQHVTLHFLSEIHHSSAESLVVSCRVRIAGVFGELKDKAIEQHRWDSADRYQAIERRYMSNSPTWLKRRKFQKYDNGAITETSAGMDAKQWVECSIESKTTML